MGKCVLAAVGVVAPVGGVLASGLSAAPTSADAPSSTAEQTGSSEEARLRALSTTWCSAACRYCTPVGWKTVHPQIKALTGTDRFDYQKKLLAQHPRIVRGTRDSAVPEPAALQGRAGARNRRLSARTGVTSPAGRKDIFDHAAMNPPGLGQFMSDGAAVDRCKARLSLSIGDSHGANSSDPKSSASTRSTSRAPKADPLLDTGCPPRPGSRRTPRRESMSPTITLHPRKHP